MRSCLSACLLVSLSMFILPVETGAAEKVPILLDTDLGDDVDDAFALALALSHPRLDLRGVTTVAGVLDLSVVTNAKEKQRLSAYKSGDAHTRAIIACRLLNAVGRGAVPVAAGGPSREQPFFWMGQFQYAMRPWSG